MHSDHWVSFLLLLAPWGWELLFSSTQLPFEKQFLWNMVPCCHNNVSKNFKQQTTCSMQLSTVTWLLYAFVLYCLGCCVDCMPWVSYSTVGMLWSSQGWRVKLSLLEFFAGRSGQSCISFLALRSEKFVVYHARTHMWTFMDTTWNNLGLTIFAWIKHQYCHHFSPAHTVTKIWWFGMHGCVFLGMWKYEYICIHVQSVIYAVLGRKGETICYDVSPNSSGKTSSSPVCILCMRPLVTTVARVMARYGTKD